MAKPVLEFLDVVKRYGDYVAVDGVSFALAPGEFFTLLGPSGCGKTTTLRLIAGLEEPDDGEIRLNGEPQCTSRYAGCLQSAGVRAEDCERGDVPQPPKPKPPWDT